MNSSKRNIKGWAEFEYHPSADQIADIFWEMDEEEQAGFFNRLGEISGSTLPSQLQSVTDCEHLDRSGRYAMKLIGDYAEALK